MSLGYSLCSITNSIYIVVMLLFANSVYTFKSSRIVNTARLLSVKLPDTAIDSSNVNQINNSDHLLSVAPMMDYTNRFQRYFMRLLSKKAVLYTEMVTSNSIIERYKRNEIIRDIQTNGEIEEPLVLQVGGADPFMMKNAVSIATNLFNEININVGCPSERVSGSGCFGAKLMLSPDIVSDLSLAIGEVTNRPATVKCRIGVDDYDSYEFLHNFVDKVSSKGKVKHFIIHARKAILNANFSPADNRSIPPLIYDRVYQLVTDFPNLIFSINGGFTSINSIDEQLNHGICGVMVGRSIINDPYHWRYIDTKVYKQNNDPGYSRREIIIKYAEYCKSIENNEGQKSRTSLVKPLHNLFHNEPYTKQFKVSIDNLIRDKSMNIYDVIMTSAFKTNISDHILDKL